MASYLRAEEYVEAFDTKFEVVPNIGALDFLPGGMCADYIAATFSFLAALPFQGSFAFGAPELHHIWHLFAGRAVWYGSRGTVSLERRMREEGKLTDQDEINLGFLRP